MGNKTHLISSLYPLLWAAAVAADATNDIWDGKIGYTAYDGAGCKNPVAHGFTTKVIKMKDEEGPLFCETDIVDNTTAYTKLNFSRCTTDEEGGIFFSLVQCSDEACSTCADDSSPEFTGYMTFNTARTMYNTVGSCFEYVGLTADEEQLATEGSVGDIMSTNDSTNAVVPSVFQTFDADTDLSNLRTYWDVMFGNSCAFSHPDVEAFIAGRTEGTVWSERTTAIAAGDKALPVALTYDIPPYITNEGTGGLETAILISALDKGTDEFTFLQMSYDQIETAIGRGVADIALSINIPVDGSYEKKDNGKLVYLSYPSWPFHNYVFTKTMDNINNNEPITSIKELANYGPVFTWEGAVDELGDEFNQVFSNNSNYQPIGNQTEQVELFWNTSDALIVIDRTIFLAISEKIVENVPLDQLLVEHNLFDAVTTFGIGFKSKDMRDQFNSGLARMCESGDYRELLVEYGVDLADDSKVICDIASGGAALTVLFSTVAVVVSFSLFLFQW